LVGTHDPVPTIQLLLIIDAFVHVLLHTALKLPPDDIYVGRHCSVHIPPSTVYVALQFDEYVCPIGNSGYPMHAEVYTYRIALSANA
jgi:hypothetical protein